MTQNLYSNRGGDQPPKPLPFPMPYAYTPHSPVSTPRPVTWPSLTAAGSAFPSRLVFPSFVSGFSTDPISGCGVLSIGGRGLSGSCCRGLSNTSFTMAGANRPRISAVACQRAFCVSERWSGAGAASGAADDAGGGGRRMSALAMTRRTFFRDSRVASCCSVVSKCFNVCRERREG